MSFQRAVVNCRRCYTLAQSQLETDLYKDKTNENEMIWNARNEAMKALEQQDGLAILGEYGKSTIECLDLCMSCTYKRAEIAEIFDPSGHKRLI